MEVNAILDAAAWSYWFSDQLSLVIGLALAGVAAAVYLKSRRSQNLAKSILDDAIAKNLSEPFSLHPRIDPNLCAGCGACVKACPEGDILQLINHRAALVAPTKCVGHGECEAACPFDAITLVFGTKTRGKELPRITSNYETNISGLYIAGELGGMGLIRNAVRQGRKAAEHAAAQIKRLTQTETSDFDLVIVGAGPAGIAASLAAKQENLRYVCLEQEHFGGTIANFPRQKIIMSQPAELPIIGPMRFPRHRVSKEELMQAWDDIRHGQHLKIKEHTRFTNLEKRDGIFHIQTTDSTLTALRVILATGVRGTPRRLGLAGESLSKVTYNLLEPEQYRARQIAVVGSGNAATEAVDMLCKSDLGNTVSMLAVTSGFDRCNAENEAKVLSAAKSGRAKLYFNTKVESIHPDYLEITVNGQSQKLPNDFLFIFIGSELQTKFFNQLGIKVEQKFGEPLNKRPDPA